MGLEEASFDHSTYSKNRARLIEHEIAKDFFAGVIARAKEQQLLCDEHFTVDGTLIESWASFKSLKRKDGEPPKSGSDGTGMVDFKGEKRSNKTHESSTDPEAKLMRKGNGQPAKLSFGAHALMENRSGLLVDVAITDSTLFEPKAAAPMLDRRRRDRQGMRTLGADKGYFNKSFVALLRGRKVTPHIARIESRRAPGLARASRATPCACAKAAPCAYRAGRASPPPGRAPRRSRCRAQTSAPAGRAPPSA